MQRQGNFRHRWKCNAWDSIFGVLRYCKVDCVRRGVSGAVRDNHAEGMVFSKRLDIEETFNGGERASKSNLKTYSQNLEKNIFCSEIYDFVIKFS